MERCQQLGEEAAEDVFILDIYNGSAYPWDTQAKKVLYSSPPAPSLLLLETCANPSFPPLASLDKAVLAHLPLCTLFAPPS